MFLRMLKPYSSLPEETITALTKVSELVSYKTGEYILTAGKPSDHVGIVISGSVRVYLAGVPEGNELFSHFLGPGQMVGEVICLSDHKIAYVSLVADEPTDCLRMLEKDFRRIVEESSHFCALTNRLMASKLINITRLLAASVGSRAVGDRITTLLITLAEEKTNRLEITRSLSQQDIADMVGASREVVNKHIGRLKKEGLLQVVNRKMVLSTSLKRT